MLLWSVRRRQSDCLIVWRRRRLRTTFLFSVTDCLTFRQSFDQFRLSDIRTDGLCQFVWLPELLCCCCCCCYWVSVVRSTIDRPTDRRTDERIDRASKRVSWAITVANQAASQLLIVLWVGNVSWFRWTRAFYCFLAVFIYLFFCKLFSLYWYFFRTVQISRKCYYKCQYFCETNVKQFVCAIMNFV